MKKSFKKAAILAKNSPKGSYVAGCNLRGRGYTDPLNNCEYCKTTY